MTSAGVERQVSTERDQGVLVVTLDQPSVLNSFDDLMLDQLGEAFRLARRDSAIDSVVLTGRGRAFCAGANLKAAWNPHSQIMGLRKRLNPVILSIAAMEIPVICAVNGVTAGAGLGLMGACDVRVASEDAIFVPATSRIGLAPDGGITYSLPRLIGSGRTIQWLLEGQKIDSITALSWGLIDEAVSSAAVLPRAIELARLLGGSTPGVSLAVKRLVRASDRNSLADQLELEAQEQDITLDSSPKASTSSHLSDGNKS